MKALVLLVALLMVCCKPKNGPEILTGASMGTTWKLAWRGKPAPGMEKAVHDTLQKWEDVLSQWKPDSDLSRHNRGEPTTPELQQVIDLAEQVRADSGGAFDHRMLKETGEAGFGPGGSGIDLSAIGKGFAVDRVGDRLRELGVKDFVFELGGEILAGEAAWDVAIEKPDPATRQTARTVALRNRALATSGNYRLFKPAGGRLLASHIINPKTHQPVIRPPSSVSVFAKDCATADAWATALFVLGEDFQPPDGIEAVWNANP